MAEILEKKELARFARHIIERICPSVSQSLCLIYLMHWLGSDQVRSLFWLLCH